MNLSLTPGLFFMVFRMLGLRVCGFFAESRL